MGGALPKRRAAVLLPYPFYGAFDYAVPPGIDVTPGDVVSVPLGRRTEWGVVWDAAGDGQVADARLKPISAVLAVPRMADNLRRFVDWVAAYTMSPPGEVMAMAMRAAPHGEGPIAHGWRIVPDAPVDVRVTKERARVLAVLADGAMLSGPDLARAAEVGSAVIRGMARAGLLEPVALAQRPLFGMPDLVRAGPVLGAEQEIAARALCDAVKSRTFSVSLLDGVTGSGKTEVYLEAVAEALRSGRQALVLLPEIALSAQWLERFQQRFGTMPAQWHSDLSPGLRKRTWRAVADGSAPVVVGARSALFLPFPDLGLIIVDEEHETAFKQEDGVIYHARDMAVVRARFESAPIALVSATPSLETVANVEAGRYHELTLTARHGAASMPDIATVDLREAPPERGKFLSPQLIAAVNETIAAGDQAMLFLNRRGYAPLTLCRSCGHRMQCPQCTAWLVEHRHARRLQCHHCGHQIPTPETCPECGAAHALTAIGPGVERITEEAREVFPEARIQVMSSDTIEHPSQTTDAVRAITERDVDLVIGTQIIAKGWHFPHLTLVGVVDADLGLGGGDLRAAEHTVQLLHQVAGRAGRAEKPGRVLLQTFSPEHPVMQALVSGNLAGFRAAEAAARRPGNWPPYGRLVALIVSGEDAHAVDKAARDIGLAAPRMDGVVVLGPAPAPLALLRGRHRRRLLLKARKDVAVQKLVHAWLAGVQLPSRVRVDVDIDPVSFM